MKEQAMKSCPSYDGCKAPICPLESVYPTKKRFNLPGEARCVANKRTRYRLGKGLKFHGLFAREYQGMDRMGALEAFEAKCLGPNRRNEWAVPLNDGLEQPKQGV